MERFTKREIKQHIVDTLRDWADGDGILEKEAGLCYNFDRLITDIFGLRSGPCYWFMQDAFKRWPKFSGDEAYPVPATLLGCSPLWMYGYGDTIDKWGDDDYSQLRRELCDFIADEFELVGVVA